MNGADTKPSADVAGEVLRIDPALIDADLPGRIGQFFPLKAEGLACRIAADGQLEPILIAAAGGRAGGRFRLVAGLHRLEACRSLGRAVEARVISGTKEHLRKLQAAENLDRRRMTVLEDAMFVAAVADIAQARVFAKHGVTSAQALGAARTNARGKFAPSAMRDDGKVHFLAPERTSDEIAAADEDAEAGLQALSAAYSWREEVRDALGLSLDKVKRALRIHRQLVIPFPELMDALKDHPVADNASALLKLAATAKEGREAELRALIDADGEAAPEPPAVDPKVAIYNRALKSLSRMAPIEHDALIEARIAELGLASQRRVFAQLQAKLGKA